MQWNRVDRVIETGPLCDVIGTLAARRTFVVHALEEGMSPRIAITDMTRKNLMTTMFSK